MPLWIHNVKICAASSEGLLKKAVSSEDHGASLDSQECRSYGCLQISRIWNFWSDFAMALKNSHAWIVLPMVQFFGEMKQLPEFIIVTFKYLIISCSARWLRSFALQNQAQVSCTIPSVYENMFPVFIMVLHPRI